MTRSFTYRHATTPAGPGWTEDISIRLGSISGVSQEAELIAVGVSQISIDDPDADVGHDGDAIVGLTQFDWTDSAAPSGHRRIWTGYINDRKYRRGSDSESPSLITGPARLIDTTLSDINSFLTFRVLGVDETSAFDRPEETDVERIQALLAVDFLSTTLFDGLVSAANPKPMDAVNYEDQTPAEVINDCCQQSGKNAFVFYDEAGDYGTAGDFVLFYDSNDSLVFPANGTDFAVSNVLTDIDMDADDLMTGPVWGPTHDAELTRDPSRVFAGIKLRYANGSVYVSNLATSYAFGYRDLVVDAPNVKTETKALARAYRMLADLNSEDDRFTVTLTLPGAHVNDWMAGQYAPCRFEHLPGYDVEGGRNVRALSRTVSQERLTPLEYKVQYECTPMTEIVVTCPTALGQVIVASAEGSNTAEGTGTVDIVVGTTVDITPDPGTASVLLSYIATVGGDVAVDHAMTTPAGYTLLESFNDADGFGVANVDTPRLLSYKAVASPSGNYTAANSYEKGWGKTKWVNVQVAVPTSATSPVQSSDTVSAGGAVLDASFASPPTPGNIIFAFVTTPAFTLTVAQTGWAEVASYEIHQPAHDPGDTSRNRLVKVLARCYVDGDGQEPDGSVWRFGYAGGGSGYSIFLSEWVIS